MYIRNQRADRIKFYLKHHWGRGKAALGLGSDWIRTLVSMENVVNTLAPSFFMGSCSILLVRRTTIKSWMSSKFCQIRPWAAELAALELLEKSP